MGRDLRAAALVFLLSFGIERMSVAVAQATFWIYAALVGLCLGDLPRLYRPEHHAGIFRDGGPRSERLASTAIRPSATSPPWARS